MFAPIIAQIVWSDLLGYAKDAWFILLVLIGFSVIIFVHELGHFLMAKWVGIRVETFAIGFGPRLLGFKYGGTDYCLRLLPLGGYVKMMGQEDFAMDQDRVQATQIDPHSFLAKTPGQRALVVSGGVVMNVLFAAIAFIVVFMSGLEFPAPIAGAVFPGSPADAAGIKPGDKFLSANGHWVHNFNELQLTIATSDPASGVNLEILRKGKVVHTLVKPRENKKEELLQIGIAQAASTTVWDPGLPGPDGKSLLEGDVIVRVGSVEPEYYNDIEQRIMEAGGKPVEVTVERNSDGKIETVKVQKRAFLILLAPPHQTATGSSMHGTQNLIDDTQNNVSLLGLMPRRMFISQPDVSGDNLTLSEYARGGDVIVQVGKMLHPTRHEIQEFLMDHRGGEAQIDVLRNDERKTVKVQVPWRMAKFEYLLGQMGFDDLHPIVASVVPGSPASGLDLPRGAKILSCDNQTVETWFDLVACLETHAGKKAAIGFEHGGKKYTAAMAVPKLDAWASTVTYGIDFYNRPMMLTLKGNNPYEALRLGLRQTWNVIKSVYVTMQRLAITHTIGVKQLSGPIYIIHKGKEVAEAGFNKLLYYMALISANLAVINFLPMPVVDGGLMLILLYEKLRGKGLSARATAIWQSVGITLILALFLFVTYNDVAKIIRGQ